MKSLFKLWAALCAAACMLLTACSALPEGAQKPSLTIDKVYLINEEGMAYFGIDVSFEHHSPEPLNLLGLNIDVFVNGVRAAAAREEIKDQSVPNGVAQHYSLKVRGDLLGAAASRSLALNSMAMVRASVAVQAVFDRSKDNLDFNPSADFEGIIGHGTL